VSSKKKSKEKKSPILDALRAFREEDWSKIANKSARNIFKKTGEAPNGEGS